MVFLVIILILMIAFLIALFIAVALLVIPIIRGAPYAPTQPETVKKMVELAQVKTGVKAADLGSGDGRLVIALAKAGAVAHGYEINPVLVRRSRCAIQKHGLRHTAFIHWGSFWSENLGDFDVITVFGVRYIMRGLEAKLKAELKPGACVVSNAFTFPNWQPESKSDNLYLYKQQAR